MSFLRTLAVATLCAFCLASGAPAQSYPNRPVIMLVAFPPGGADDATARIVQDPMQRALGQPIVIENVGGAGGMIAAAKAARAEPTATPSSCTR
jgi:tripartite-type tricarboxylate transporter receptor subunit TctC